MVLSKLLLKENTRAQEVIWPQPGLLLRNLIHVAIVGIHGRLHGLLITAALWSSFTVGIMGIYGKPYSSRNSA